MTTEGSHPDLTGKTVVVAGTDFAVVEVVRLLVREHVLLAVVSADRQFVDAATRIAESAGTPILGMTSDPSDPQVWQRNAPHVEQRLGPIDIAIAIGAVGVREQVAAIFLADMRRRRHGVFVEVDSAVQAQELGDGILHRYVRTANMDAKAIADSVLDALGQAASQD